MHKHNPQGRTHSFVADIQVIRGSGGGATEEGFGQVPHQPRPKLNLSSAMKLFRRFRKVIMRLMLLVPSRGSSSDSTSRNRNSERFEPPKTSCSSYYSHSHYNEAIADCIEFFNKSAQDGILDGRKSDVV